MKYEICTADPSRSTITKQLIATLVGCKGEVKDKGRIQVEHLVFAFWLILPISQGHPSISEDMSLPHFSLFCKCFAEVGHISFSVVPFSCEN